MPEGDLPLGRSVCAASRPAYAQVSSRIRLSGVTALTVAISRDAGDNTPQTLHVRLVGRMRHARIDTRWLAPRG